MNHLPSAISHQPWQNTSMRMALPLVLFLQLITPAPKPGHATILSSPPDVSGKAGAKLALFVDVTPKPGIHVNAQPAIKAGKITYPKSEIVSIADEKVPVFQRPFRLTQDVTVDRSAKPGSTVVVAGTVSYQ